MVGLDEHLKDPLYANWVKNTCALNIVNAVLKPYVHGEVEKIHGSIISGFRAGVTCGSCSWRQAPRCRNNICNIIKNEIEVNHRYDNPSFDNTNARGCKSDAWEVAKCFMPISKGYRECTSSDADFSAIVNIVINCKAFDELVWCDLDQPENIFSEARKMRNYLMHSDEQKIAESVLQTNLDLLVCILNDFKTIPPNSTDAKEKLTKLKAGRLQVTLDEVLEVREQFLQAKWATREFVDDQIAKLRQEIQGTGTFWKVQQHKLICNFVKGCKYSLVKTMERHINKVRPEGYPHHEWNLSILLNKLDVNLEIKALSSLHMRLLYPEDGNTVDINDWDLFLLCHMLSIESVFELDNNEKTYIQEIKNFRDNILTNPDKIAEEDLKVLAEFLKEPLGHEIINIYGGEDIKDDAVKLHNILTFWRQEEDNMENKQISTKALQKEEKNAERIEALENDVQQLKQLLGNKTDTGSKPEGHHQGIETNVQVKLKHCDKKEEEQVQNNMTSEDEAENIFLANGGRDDFCEKMPVKTAQPIKGSIILKVTCESIKDLVRFWHSCTDGSALRALSKVRDDYRKFLGCQTLDFDIILTKKEVNRCMEYLIDRLSSRISDISALEKVLGTPTLVETVPVEAEDASKENMDILTGESDRGIALETRITSFGDRRMEEMKQFEQEPEKSSGTLKQTLVSLEKLHGVSEEVHDEPARSKELKTDEDRPGLSTTDTLMKGAKYGEENATRLVKFLEEIAENFEEGKISVIKPYLVQLIKHSKERDKEAFDEVIMDFTEATKFRSGISVSLMKQAFRGFRMILTEPEFGDLVAAKVEAIEKQEGIMGGEESKAWQIDPKISAEDIQVGDKIAKEPSKTSDTVHGKPDQRAGTSKGLEYYKTEKDVSPGSKLSPGVRVTGGSDFSKPDPLKSKMAELTTLDIETKSMESMSFKQKPGSPGSVEATETTPAPKS